MTRLRNPNAFAVPAGNQAKDNVCLSHAIRSAIPRVALACLISFNLAACGGGSSDQELSAARASSTAASSVADDGVPSESASDFSSPIGAVPDSDGVEDARALAIGDALQAAEHKAVATAGGAATATSTSLPANVPMSIDTVAIPTASGLALTGSRVYRPTTGGTPGIRPVVVMLHGCGGAASSLFDRWGQTFVNEGYVAVLVNSFTARGATNECGNGAAGVSEVNDRPGDARAGLDYMVARYGADPSHAALLGWSHGGSSLLATLWHGQTRQPFRVGVAFYPGCGLSGLIRDPWPTVPVQIFHGESDTTTPLARCTTLKQKIKGTPGDALVDITTYAGAAHSFDNALQNCPAGRACTYGSASGRTLTASDWAAKSDADPKALAFIKQRI